MRSITSLLSLVVLGILVLVLSQTPGRSEDVVVLSGRVEGNAQEGKFPMAFHFFDKETHALVHRAVGDLQVHSGSYEVALEPGPLSGGGEFYVCATSPEVEMSSFQGQAADPWGLVRLQPSTPGIPQTGHVNISGTLIAGAIKTNSFQMSTGAASGRVLTSDASGNGTWQVLPPPSGAAGGDLSGTYPNPLVDGLQGFAVASTAPTAGQVLKWDGSAWSPSSDLRDQFWQSSGNNISYNAGNVGLGVTPITRLDILGGNWDTSTSEGDLRLGDSANRLKIGIATSGGGAGHVTIAAQGGINALSMGAGTTLTTQRTLTIRGSGRVGIGTIDPLYTLHAETGAGDRAICGVHTATDGIAYGVYGQSDSSYVGIGVFGVATAPQGAAIGVYGQSDSNAGYAVRGWASATGGITAGGWFQCESTSGIGVAGFAGALSGYNIGVSGLTWSTSGIGVRGTAFASVGTTYGVWGGIVSSSGYGVFSDGNFAATGTKSFQIDHPLSPETHYLNHFCTEGPEPMNAYSGNVVTDARGYATVRLPDYFESINRDFRYQLTCVGQFAQAIVAEKVRNNQFVIRTDKPHVEVSWRVEAIRNDRWVQKYGFKTEQEKPEEHQGKYLRPELYGMPKEYGIFYRPDPEEMRTGEMRDRRISQTNRRAKSPKSPKSR